MQDAPNLAAEENALRAAKNLLSLSDRGPANEGSVRQNLVLVLDNLGIESDPDYPTGDGPVDLHLPRRRILIETKTRGSASLRDPHSIQAGRNESAFDQLERYIQALIEREDEIPNLYETEEDSRRPWKGFLTDGKVWYAWSWAHKGRASAEEIFGHRSIENPDKLAEFVKEKIASEQPVGKPHIPSDPTSVFQGCLDGLRDVRDKRGSWKKQALETKFQLWLDMLRTSGMAPGTDAKRQELFLSHSLLVAIARGVIHTVDQPFENPSPTELLKDGFVAWISETDEGERWAQETLDIVHSYEWRLERIDVMRRVYQGIVDASDRKIFGEYYTPDWLARLLAESVLDEEWREQSARKALLSVRQNKPLGKGVGVLDPACGSGTFLYHAARLLLDSEEMKRESSQQRKSDAVCRLVNGIDIHPVAVELARATLRRALPTPPTDGLAALKVFQGDSLLATASSLFRPDQKGHDLLIETPKGKEVRIPKTFASKESFVPDMRDIVKAAQASETERAGQLPDHLAEGPHARALGEALHGIRKIIETEGNSVWTWYISNITAPVLLSESKVNRIVANPPWVRMNEIQEESRKRTLEILAGKPSGKNKFTIIVEPLKHPPWSGGRNATGFDIAQLFVMRCREKYLANPDGDPAAWLVNASVVSGQNWAEFRKGNKEHLQQILDFSNLKEPPFTVSCVALLEHHRCRHAQIRTRSKRLMVKALDSAKPVSRDSDPEEALRRIEFTRPPKSIPRAPSAYDGCFRNGATIFPRPLLTADIIDDDGRRAKVRTKPTGSKAKKPWDDIMPREGELPSRWIAKAAFTNDLLPFCLRPELMTVLIPRNKEGQLVSEAEALGEPFWKSLDDLYQQKCGTGGNTPQTLLKQLDYQKKLSSQLPLADFRRRAKRKGVTYPKSGKIMRASRFAQGVAIENSLYRWQAHSEKEAAYLVALLNAPALQQAFDAARTAKWDFHLSPWRGVPIPEFDPENETHCTLAEMTFEAENLAEEWLRKYGTPEDKQNKLSKGIRCLLSESGVLDEINRLTKKLLPRQAR